MKKYTRCVLIIWNGNLLHNLKTIHPRVKSQVRGPNDKSSAWKWETIPLYTLTLFYMGGDQNDPPDWLSYSNPRGMPWMGWFFMTLFLAILESSWVVHFWDFFLKFPKHFTSTIFFAYNPKGGPSYASKNAFIFGVLFGIKNGNDSTPNG